MHLYVKKIEDKDCGSNGIMLTHDIVRFFFNPEKSFFENLGTSKSYSFAHFKNAREIKDINVRKINGFFYIDSAVVSLLRENHEDMAIGDLLYVEQVETTYRIKLIKVGDQNYETFNILLNKNDRHLLLLSDEKESDEENDLETSKKEKTPDQPLGPPKQIIYYGVPGCGKSHTVDAEINKAIKEYNVGKEKDLQITYEKQVIRTVFHPDYCNADFIGQLMPKKGKESGIKYEFKPGPLATIIRKAYLNPKKPYFLVIEEINRGNAAAIFGEMFQLLDRYKKNEHSKTEDTQNENYDYTEGWSKYSVNNDELNEFILLGGESKIVEKEPGVEYDSDFPDGPKAAIKIPSIGLHFSTYCGVRLPPNLSIYATMNTSDQNVFTLDNAFQRRWEMKQVPNELKDKIPANASEEDKKIIQAEIDQYNKTIGNTNVKWGDFRKAINEVIMDSAQANGLSSMEDKRLGGWFFTPADNFAEKVLKYLWDDAFKFDRKTQFGEIKTLEDLVKKFNKDGFKIFKADAISKLQRDSSTTPDTPAQNDTSVTNG